MGDVGGGGISSSSGDSGGGIDSTVSTASGSSGSGSGSDTDSSFNPIGEIYLSFRASRTTFISHTARKLLPHTCTFGNT